MDRTLVNALIARLDKGWALINETKKQGLPVTDLEDLWINVLDQYCEAEDALRGGSRGSSSH